MFSCANNMGVAFLAEGGSAGGDVPRRLRAPASLGNSVHTLIVVLDRKCSENQKVV